MQAPTAAETQAILEKKQKAEKRKSFIQGMGLGIFITLLILFVWYSVKLKKASPAAREALESIGF